MELLHILTTAANAVLPIILLILLGYFLKRKNFLSKEFIKTGNKLVFRVCLPCTLFINVYDIKGFSSIGWDVVAYSCLAVCFIAVLGFATAIAVTPIPRRRGVIAQCTFRSNFAIIGLTLASELGGKEAEAVAAVVSAFTIPLFNILGVVALTIFTDDPGAGKKRIRSILLSIAKNPLICGVVLGLALLGLRGLQQQIWDAPVFTIREHLPFVYKTLRSLKNIASPLALIVLGGQFEFSAVRGMFPEILTGSLWRLVLAPALGIGGALLLTRADVLSCGVNEYPALIALFGSPVAVSSAIMAGEMGADEQLATQLVIWTSLFSIVTIFLLVCLMMAGGLLQM